MIDDDVILRQMERELAMLDRELGQLDCSAPGILPLANIVHQMLDHLRTLVNVVRQPARPETGEQQ